MAITRNMPMIGATGVYTVAAPFTLEASTVYVCRSVRSFSEMENAGTDVYALLYEPNGLAESVYEADRAADVHVASLYGRSGVFVNVPDSYITSMPTGDQVDYGSIVLAVKLGALPLYLTYDDALTEIVDVVQQRIGVTVSTDVMAGPLKGDPVTYQQHSQLETAREAARSGSTSLAAKNRALEGQVNSLTQLLQNAERILKANGLLG